MMEVLVASFVFFIAVFGVVSSISLLSPHSANASKRLQAAYLAKNLIDGLRGSLTPTSWDDAGGDLAIGSHTRTAGDFTLNWTVTAEASGTLRKIVVQVTY